MDWEDLAIAGISQVFNLDPRAKAAIAAARFAHKMYRRQNPGPGAERKRANAEIARAAKRARRFPNGVPNVIPGGSGHYMGDFRKTAVSTNESSITRHGFIQEQEVFGQVATEDIQYIGFQSVTPLVVIPALSTALIRMIMWRHFRSVFPSTSDLIYPTTGQIGLVYRLDWITRSKQIDGAWTKQVHPGTVIVSGTTTLQNLVDQLSAYFLTEQFGFRLQNDARRFCGYRFVYNDFTTFTYSNDYNLEEQMLRLNVLNVIQLQNTTRADELTVAFSRDAIDANPIVGSVFTMRGLYPDIEGNYDIDTTSFVKELQIANGIGLQYGVIIPDVVPTGGFRSIPNPQIFSEIMKCESGLRMEPGEIKKDVLRFSFSGKLVDLIDGLAYLHSGPVSGYRKRRFGVVKLFAFEKVVPTGSDFVEMNYHVDRYVNCVFKENYQTASIRKDYLQYQFDRLLGPAARVANTLQRAEVDVDATLTPINDEEETVVEE